MSNYNIKFTNSDKSPIVVNEAGLNTDVDLFLPGRVRGEWGSEINENFIRLLERFACPQDLTISPGGPVVPDLSVVNTPALQNPVKGQLWYNTTDRKLYSYDDTYWNPYALSGEEYGANWGQIIHGEQLPLPVSPNGYEFTYEECIWSVSPKNYIFGISWMVCHSDFQDSTVSMQYRVKNTGVTIDGVANYLIVGIRGNQNVGDPIDPILTPENSYCSPIFCPP